MLVGFSGPSGSGKTTLVTTLSQRLNDKGYDVGVVKEVVREVFARYRDKYGYESLSDIRNSEHLMEFQMEILREQIRQEDSAMEEHEIVLTDRTIYDNLFFTIPVVYRADFDLLEEYMSVFTQREAEKKYNLIFFCKPVHGDVDDGFRTTELRYREMQELVIWRLLNGTPRVTVEFMPLEQRVDFCLRVLVDVLGNGRR